MSILEDGYDIASELGIAIRTLKLHRMNMMRKTGTANVIELARLIDKLYRKR